MFRRYRFKLYPTPMQADALHAQRRMMVDLWNAMKQRIEDVYRREGRFLDYVKLCDEITELRHACPEWQAVPVGTSKRIAKTLTDGYLAFFNHDRQGPPRWRGFRDDVGIPLGTVPFGGWKLHQRTDNPLSWTLHYKSITKRTDKTTWIHARGCLPVEPTDWRNADILFDGRNWFLSIVIDVPSRRVIGRWPIRLNFDLIDHFVTVNGIAEEPDGMTALQLIADEIDGMKSKRDLQFPRRRRRTDEEQLECRSQSAAIRNRAGYLTRCRNNALHVWTARIIERASDLTITAPTIKERTKSPRGDATAWGSNVETVSTLNRHVLSFAPARAIAMLQYKAEEAGIRCDVVTPADPSIAVGGDLVVIGKSIRRARRVAAAVPV